MRNRRAAPLQSSGNLGSGAGRWTETVGGPKRPPCFPWSRSRTATQKSNTSTNQIPAPGELESVSPSALTYSSSDRFAGVASQAKAAERDTRSGAERGWQGDRQPFYFFAEKPRDHTCRPTHNAEYASVRLSRPSSSMVLAFSASAI